MVVERFSIMDGRASTLLIGVALLVMVARVASPLLQRVQGRHLRRLPVPFVAKARRQRFPLVLIGMAVGGNLLAGQAALALHLGAMAITSGLLALPAHCVITDQGIRAGWTPFRRWSEFAGLSVRRGNIMLQPLSGLANLEITLPGRFEDADIVSEMRTLIRLGYQGSRQSDDGAAESGEESGTPPLALA